MAVRIVSARWVIPVDGPLVSEGAVVLDGEGTIVAVGPRAALRAELPDAPEERALGALVPGLVNAHCHLELSALADAVPGGNGLVSWASGVMKTAATISPERRREGAAEAADDAARLGTAAVGDVGNTLDAVPALQRAGLRGVFFHELLGSREAATGDALADAARERAAAALDVSWPAGLAYVRTPHAPYSAGPELLRRIFEAAAAEGKPVSIHVAEDEEELRLLRDGSGQWPAVLSALGVDPRARVPGTSPVAYLERLGAFESAVPPLLVHMVHADANDRRIARERGATAVLCPRSNLHIGGRLPEVDALLADDVAIAIGTDSLASTPDLSLFAEIATLCAHFPRIPAGRWLAAATRDGARALGLRDMGTLTPGKRPGILDVLVDDVTSPLESLVRDPHPGVRWVARA